MPNIFVSNTPLSTIMQSSPTAGDQYSIEKVAQRTQRWLTLAILLSCWSLALRPLIAEDYQRPAKVIESFEEGVPSGLRVIGGSLSIDTQRYKHGSQALKWDWKGNSSILFDTPIGYRRQRPVTEADAEFSLDHTSLDESVLESPRGFFFWIYNEKATSQRLRIEFGRGEIVDCEFDFNLGFKGWRSAWILYDRGDMRGTPREDMNRMTIHAPNIGSGSFYIDTVGLSVPLNPRNNAPNPQLPNIDPHTRLVTQYAQRLLEYSKLKPTLSLEPLDAEMVSAIAGMEARAEEFFLPPFDRKKLRELGIDDLIEKFATYKIQREEDNIFGVPLVKSNIFKEYFSEAGLGKDIMNGVKEWRRDYCQLLFAVSARYQSIKDVDDRAKLEAMFIDLFDYGQDQGFAPGAGLGWLHHFSYEIREYGLAIFLMRDLLEREEKLDLAIETMKWFYGFGQVYDETTVYGIEGRKAADADDTQGLLGPRLLCALIMRDSPEKVRDLRHFSSFFSNVTTAYANALDECYKPDGTVFHHAGHAMGYGNRAINGGVSMLWLLDDSPFAARGIAHEHLKKAVTTYLQCLFTDKFEHPKAFSSIRFTQSGFPRAFYPWPAILALTADRFDAEMAGLYLQILARIDKVTPEHRWWAKKLESAGEPTAYSYPKMRLLSYSDVAIRRNADDWMITARGHSKYVYGYEAWGSSFFAFPLYIANGYLDVTYPNSLDCITPTDAKNWHDGYDWRRWPGTTTVRLPYDELESRIGQQRDEGGEYLFSDQAFCGGVETTYDAGVFAFLMKGWDKYGIESLSGKKTYFFVGDTVLCVGSDIRGDAGHSVETTLFQNHLVSPDQPITRNGKFVSEFPYEANLAANNHEWFIDNRGTGFLVRSVSDDSSLRFERRTQTAPNAQNSSMVSGNFATAYIDHGVSPQDASYEYVLMPSATPEKMNALESAPPAELTQMDSIAHVARLNQLNATAYCVYSKNGATFDQGVVKNVNKQSTFIAKEENDRLRLSLSDPDLNIYEGQDDLMPDGTRTELSIYEHEWYLWPSQPTHVRVTLKGSWKIAEQVREMETATNKSAKIISSNSDVTVVDFECRDGLSSEIILSK